MRNRCKLQMIDICLIVFMTVLFGQMVYSLFFGVASANNAMMDIVFRTTAAAIFGYFLSANFTTRELDVCDEEQVVLAQAQQIQQSVSDAHTPQARKNEIGFRSSLDTAMPSVGKVRIDTVQARSDKEKARVSNLQVVIASCFGLAALLVLIIARNFSEIDSTATATIAQMRDFFSGCVGFLLGSKNTK